MPGTVSISAIGRLKHSDLWRAAIQVGGQAALARHLNVNVLELNLWVNLKGVPPVTPEDVKRRPTWNAERHAEFARKLLTLTGKTLAEMFPEDVRQCTEFFKAPKNFEQTRELTSDQLLDYAELSRERLLPQGAHEQVEQQEVRGLIQKVLVTLPPRERRVLAKRFGIGGERETSADQLAIEEGVSRARIYQIEKKALNKLRQPKRIEPLLPYSE